jgi:voltage-gated potassium channel
MSMHPLTELDRRQRRLEITASVISALLTCSLLLVIYYLIPFDDLTSGQSLLRLAVGVVVFTVVLVWQLRGVAHAAYPVLRAVHALAVTIPVFLVAFAAVYISLSQGSAAHFSEPLDHTGALYFAITIFSTVGFGDITPEDDLARIVVSIQMLLDLVVIGLVVRLLATAAKTAHRERSPSDTEPS